MTVEELQAHLAEGGFETHGRARGRSGACYVVASRRDTSDYGDKEARVFVGVNVRAPDRDRIRLKFSVSGTALASGWVRTLIDDQEKFLLQAGLVRFRKLLLENDQPGRSEEVLLTSRSAPEDFQMDDPADLRAEVSRVQRELLELLWQHRHRGRKRTAKRAIEDHVCSELSIVDSILDSFEQRRYIVGAYGTSGIKITVAGETELERLQSQFPKATAESPGVQPGEVKGDSYDVFVSHASEDKDAFVRPLAEALRSAGIKVWYDEFTLQWGASLRESIDRGLATSRYGLVVLSHKFFAKLWSQRELNGLFATMKAGEPRILPVWHELSRDELEKYSPLLADLLAVNSAEGVAAIVERMVSLCRGG